MKLGTKIGVGNTAEVYEWENGRVIKLFFAGYPAAAIEKEYINAKSVRNMAFEKAVEHGIVTYGKRTGIVYSRIAGENLLDYLMRTGDLDRTVCLMTGLHNAILDYEMFEDNIPYYKRFLNENIERNNKLTKEQKTEYREKISALSGGSQLCHGDFHPGNIYVTSKGPAVIDFMNICRGPGLYDIARTYFLISTEEPQKQQGASEQETAGAQDADKLLRMRIQFADEYLASMRVTMEEIAPYLEVISAARIGELS